ncbi:MAG: L-2-amino-thiazoline-4-carboxylic acid hydrolase [Gammaproteobacteria bacterium]|nr:L-2-amino-thiazoline-4-carboxylic acid hydrolase [Gammaproteobacteria bacterium]
MKVSNDNLTLSEKRIIEIKAIVPIIMAFIDKFGRDKTLNILRENIAKVTEEGGRTTAADMGDNSLDAFAKLLEEFKKENSVEFEIEEQSENKLKLNVTKCKFAEIIKELNIDVDLGYELLCARDFAMIKGFNPNIKLTRDKTIMRGDKICNFCYELIK